MRTLRTTTLILILPGLLTGCASTAGVSPGIRTVASVGDKPFPVVTGAPGASVRAEAVTADRPRRNQTRISGRVVDDQGEPLPNVRVRVAVENAAAGKVISAKTDHTGAFTLRGVKAGKNYTIIAEDEAEGLIGRTEAEAPDTDVRISAAVAGSDSDRDTVKRTGRKTSVNPVSDREDLDDEEEPGPEKPSYSPKHRVNLEDIEPPPADEAESMDDPVAEKGSADRAVSRTSGWRAGTARREGPATSSSKAEDEEVKGGGKKAAQGTSPAPSPDDDGVDPLPPAREPGQARLTNPAESREKPAVVVAGAAAGLATLPAPAEEVAPAAEAGEVATPSGDKLVEATAEPTATEPELLPSPYEAKVASTASPAAGPMDATLLPEINGKAQSIVINPAGTPTEDLEKLVQAVPAAETPGDDLEKLAQAMPAAEAPSAAAEVIPAPAASEVAQAPAPAASEVAQASAPAAAEVVAVAPSASEFARASTTSAVDPFVAAEARANQTARSPVVADTRAGAKSFGERSPRSVMKSPKQLPAPPRKRPTWGDLARTSAKPVATGETLVMASGAEGRPRLASLPGSSGIRSRAAPPARDDGKSYCDFDSKQHRLRDFRLPDLQGRLVRFQDLDTDLVLIDFWGTWCRPCLRTVPHLVDLQKKLGGPRLTVVGIACEEGPPEQRVRKVSKEAQRLGINYPILMSGMDGPCPLQEAFDVKALPTLILVDRQGRVVWRDQGPTPTTLARLDRFLGATTQAEGARRRY